MGGNPTNTRYKPLTAEQESRLAPGGFRMWTDREVRIMQNNVLFYDQVQLMSLFRCQMSDCKYVIQDSKTAHAIPNVGLVCEMCWDMNQVVRYFNLRGSGGLGYGR